MKNIKLETLRKYHVVTKLSFDFWRNIFYSLFNLPNSEEFSNIFWKSKRGRNWIIQFCELKTLVTEINQTVNIFRMLETPKSEVGFDSRTQNVFRILLNLGRVDIDYGGVSRPKTPPNSASICESFKRIWKIFCCSGTQTFFRFWGYKVSRFGCKFLHFGWQAFECAITAK